MVVMTPQKAEVLLTLIRIVVNSKSSTPNKRESMIHMQCKPTKTLKVWEACQDTKKTTELTLARRPLQMDQFTQVNALMARNMVVVCRCGLIALATKVCGKMIRLTVWVHSCMLTEMSMRVCGSMIRHMAMELINTQTAQLTSVTGSKISSMVEELRHGQMAPDTMETIRMGRKTVRVFLLLQMEVSILAPSSKTRSQAKESMSGLMVRPTRECGKRTKCMVEAFSNGKMANSTRVISKTTSVKVTACSLGEMVVSMMDNGKMASSTDVEYLSRTRAQEESVFGKMDATLNG